MKSSISFASEIERMAVHREPFLATAPKSGAAQACADLHKKVTKRI
jgi:chromosome partitioning protein